MVGRNMSLKNTVTPPGIHSGAVRLVAQRLNNYATTDSETKLFYSVTLLNYRTDKAIFYLRR
jgi:hypothetical protein